MDASLAIELIQSRCDLASTFFVLLQFIGTHTDERCSAQHVDLLFDERKEMGD
jgi:hypothetical protein